MSVPQSSSQAEAEKLKAEGNALFVNNDFSAAYERYTQAIQHNSKNAVLYCNRAACSLGLNRYMDAATDAIKATEIDPTYAKAWARLANARVVGAVSALKKEDLAVEAWKRAIAVLPVENLTPAQQKQRAQYESELAKTSAKLQEAIANPKIIQATIPSADAPWNRALALVPELKAQGKWCSSAWVIGGAYSEWENAVKNMKLGHPVSGGAYFGHRGVIEGLSNALISDRRVFHIKDTNFISLYNEQVRFETAATNAWWDSGSREVMEEIPERLAQRGWNSVRPALSLTIRAWILHAFIQGNLMNNTETALDLLTSALEVLRWGQELWRDIPDEDKGAIFQPTFIRGVTCLHLDMQLQAYAEKPGVHAKALLEDLLAGANKMLEELGEVPETPDDPDCGFFLSFFRYPAGQAYALRGYYYHQSGKLLREEHGGITQEVNDLYTKAGFSYGKAATYYPDDDENHVWYLHCSAGAHGEVGAPVCHLLSLLDQIHETIPKMKRIWACFKNRDERDGPLEKQMEYREQLLESVRTGQITDLVMTCVKIEAVQNLV